MVHVIQIAFETLCPINPLPANTHARHTYAVRHACTEQQLRVVYAGEVHVADAHFDFSTACGEARADAPSKGGYLWSIQQSRQGAICRSASSIRAGTSATEGVCLPKPIHAREDRGDRAGGSTWYST
jgi:hypothetical protein